MRVFSYYSTKGLFWFRLFGIGIYFKNTDVYPALFAERNNLGSPMIKFGKYIIRFLPKN